MSVARLAACAALVVLAGCADRPIEELRPASSQQKLASVKHWDDLAYVTAVQIVNATAGLKEKSFYIRRRDTASPFHKAFYDFLVTRLLENKQTVSLSPEHAIVVNYDLQVVRRGDRPLRTLPGPFSVLAGGAIALVEGGTAAAYGLGAFTGLALDGLGNQPNTEVVVTTTLTNGDTYVMRKSSTYFIRSDDVPEYVSPIPTPAPMASPALTADGAPAKLPERSFSVTSF